MKRLVGALFLTMCVVAPASATTITWGPASISDDAAGAFLAGAGVLAAGPTWTLSLPSYSTTGTFDFPPNEVDLSLSATAIGGNIIGVTYSFFGTFTGAGSAGYLQMANAANVGGAFSIPLLTGFLPVLPTGSLNLITQLNLLDGGDSAQISEVRFELATVDIPEPATLSLVALGAAVLSRRRFRARRVDTLS